MSHVEDLSRWGLDFERLEMLSRKAANDGLVERGAWLPDDLFDDLALNLLEVGLRWAGRFDPEKAGGVSFTTSCYRRMKRRVDDWYRRTFGDRRYGRDGSAAVTATGELPEVFAMAEPDLEQVAGEVARGLAPDDVWTLQRLALPVAQGESLPDVARELGLEYSQARRRMDDLARALGHEPPTRDELVELYAGYTHLSTWSSP